MSTTRDYKVLAPWAGDAETVTPSGGAVPGTSYRSESTDDSISAKGLAFKRALESGSFNQIFYLATKLITAIESNGILGWCDLVDYPENAFSVGSDGELYSALSANGPASTVMDPVGDISNTWINYLAAVNAAIADIESDVSDNIDNIAILAQELIDHQNANNAHAAKNITASIEGNTLKTEIVQGQVDELDKKIEKGGSSAPLTVTRFIDAGTTAATRNGSVASPYSSIAEALAAITDASETKVYTLKVSSDSAVEFTAKPFILIIGESPDTVVGDITIESDDGETYHFENLKPPLTTQTGVGLTTTIKYRNCTIDTSNIESTAANSQAPTTVYVNTSINICDVKFGSVELHGSTVQRITLAHGNYAGHKTTFRNSHFEKKCILLNMQSSKIYLNNCTYGFSFTVQASGPYIVETDSLTSSIAGFATSVKYISKSRFVDFNPTGTSLDTENVSDSLKLLAQRTDSIAPLKTTKITNVSGVITDPKSIFTYELPAGSKFLRIRTRALADAELTPFDVTLTIKDAEERALYTEYYSSFAAASGYNDVMDIPVDITSPTVASTIEFQLEGTPPDGISSVVIIILTTTI